MTWLQEAPQRGGSEVPALGTVPLDRQHLQRAPSPEVRRRPPGPLPELIHRHRALRLRQVPVRAWICMKLLKQSEAQSPDVQTRSSPTASRGPSNGRCGSQAARGPAWRPNPAGRVRPRALMPPSCDWHMKAFPALLPGLQTPSSTLREGRPAQTRTSPGSTGHPSGLSRRSTRAHSGSHFRIST